MMRRAACVAGLVALSTAGVCLAEEAPRLAIAELVNGAGQKVGVVTFTEGDGGLTVVAHVTNLAPGLHGFHIHGTGACTPPGFQSAGGHFNPFGKHHGLMSATGAHVGDMPNLSVGADGTGTLLVKAPLATLGPGEGSLFGPAGTSVVVHESPDDHTTDPAGAAGGRVACGVIRRLE